MAGNDDHQGRGPSGTDQGDDASGSPQDGDPGGTGGNEGNRGRDFGDSAGYGSGGSTLDRRDVVGEESTRPNPLDEVMDTNQGD